jgi:hypothetical protein
MSCSALVEAKLNKQSDRARSQWLPRRIGPVFRINADVVRSSGAKVAVREDPDEGTPSLVTETRPGFRDDARSVSEKPGGFA